MQASSEKKIAVSTKCCFLFFLKSSESDVYISFYFLW